MKRYGNLFAAATSHDALYQGYLDARSGKRARHACHAFERALGANLHALHEELQGGHYQPLPYNTFTIREPKPRSISAPAFRDRVVQHAAYGVIQPIFDATFIDQSFACRPGLGTHAAADYVQRSLAASAPDSYTVHLDVRKFYYSIDRGTLLQLLQRKIKDARLLALMMQFASAPQPLGLPIGNLLSQLYALVYLNPVDHFIKRTLKVQRYARYVDDLMLMDLSRTEAFAARNAVEAFLRDELQLSLSKATVQPTRRGVNFVGFRTWGSRRFVRRHALTTFRQAVKRSDHAAVVSSLGHALKTASHKHMVEHLKGEWHAIHRCLPKNHRRVQHL